MNDDHDRSPNELGLGPYRAASLAPTPLAPSRSWWRSLGCYAVGFFSLGFRGHRWRIVRENYPRAVAMMRLHPLAGKDAVCMRCGRTFLDFGGVVLPKWQQVIDEVTRCLHLETLDDDGVRAMLNEAIGHGRGTDPPFDGVPQRAVNRADGSDTTTTILDALVGVAARIDGLDAQAAEQRATLRRMESDLGVEKERASLTPYPTGRRR